MAYVVTNALSHSFTSFSSDARRYRPCGNPAGLKQEDITVPMRQERWRYPCTFSRPWSRHHNGRTMIP